LSLHALHAGKELVSSESKMNKRAERSKKRKRISRETNKPESEGKNKSR
jgi:hypothetical protein